MPSSIQHSILIAIGLVQTAMGSPAPLPSIGVYVEIKHGGLRVADLAFNRPEGTRSIIPDLALRKSNTNTDTPLGRYLTGNCYTLGNDQDVPKFPKCTLNDILYFSPRATHICVDRDSSDGKGKYSRANLLLGRVIVGYYRTAQFNISLVLVESLRAAVSGVDHDHSYSKVGMTDDRDQALHTAADGPRPSGGEPTVDQDGPMDLSMTRSHDPPVASVDTSQGGGQLMGRKRARKQSKPRRILQIDRREDN
ncbi:hypothetical protein FOZ63_008336 [Perkinsus olseni]|uniref:Uncharacterized protein n=1 Tax=Perkinsus olseni TaxID=32597 RepID=A0A7J6UNK7_PEROL|nr:hypothetical protein FOZ62_032017 [Perkinsus olseni]KAF4758854.1 hypothetical protein FOZ63_008336 [Perkinsus olseni]